MSNKEPQGTPDEIQAWKLSREILRRARKGDQLDYREIRQTIQNLEAAMKYEQVSA